MSNRRTATERLADMEDQKRQLAARIAALSAREKSKQRKVEDRRRMLLGSMVLADLPNEQGLVAYVRTRLVDLTAADRQMLLPLLGGEDRQ